jgi:hypothetical protein
MTGVWHAWGRNSRRVSVGKTSERDCWEELGVDGSVILKRDVGELRCNASYLIYLAENSDTWQAVMNAVKKQVP